MALSRVFVGMSIGILVATVSPAAAVRTSQTASLDTKMREQRYTVHGSQSQQGYREAEADRVTDLPGWGPVEGIYAGYVTVDEDHGRHLFYTYVESSRSPDTDPLLLWLNGGPGCSSIGGGFMSELGPFLPMPGGKTLQANPYSWNRVANVLFVESPAFVGFSYSDTPSDAVVGDARTAADMRKFLLGFIKRFPSLATRDLYISGESYAGHYLPTLAWEIVQGNERAAVAAGGRGDPGPAEGFINLRGIAAGNPLTDTAVDNLGAIDFWWAHALISDSTALGIKTNCDLNQIGPLNAQLGSPEAQGRAKKCERFCNTAMEELGPINIYEIYADVCTQPGAARAAQTLAAALMGPNTTIAGTVPLLGVAAARMTDALRRSATLQRVQGNKASLSKGGPKNEDDSDDDDGPTTYDPCTDNEATTYLNLPEVQRALHANVSGLLPGPWQDCTNDISYSRGDLLSSMLPVWQRLINTPGLRFLVYSGDVDGILPVVGTRRWVAALGLPEVSRWRPWQSGPTGQVGGYVVEYSTRRSDLSATAASRRALKAAQQQPEIMHAAAKSSRGEFIFSTVRNAGHMVPYVQPQRALHMMSRFLSGQQL